MYRGSGYWLGCTCIVVAEDAEKARHAIIAILEKSPGLIKDNAKIFDIKEGDLSHPSFQSFPADTPGLVFFDNGDY